MVETSVKRHAEDRRTDGVRAFVAGPHGCAVPGAGCAAIRISREPVACRPAPARSG